MILQSCLCVWGLLPGIERSWWKVAQTFSTCSRKANRRIAGCWSTSCTHCRRALQNTPLNVSHHCGDFPKDSSVRFFTLSQFLLRRMVRLCWSQWKDFHWIHMIAGSELDRFAPMVFLMLVWYGRFRPSVICNGKGYLLRAHEFENWARLGSVSVSYCLLVVVYFSFTGKCFGLGAAWACLAALIPSARNGSLLEAPHPHSTSSGSLWWLNPKCWKSNLLAVWMQ